MNSVLLRLRDDHRRFERFFKAIEHECARLEAGKPADMARLRAIVSYLGSQAFPRHHALEEAIFAQIATRAPQFRLDIFDLSEDHHTSRQEFVAFARAVAKGAETLAEAARSFIANERGHFISEEEIVFGYADRHLASDQWEELREEFDVDESEEKANGLELIADLLA